MNTQRPIPLQWYTQKETGYLFEVVAVDEEPAVIDIQDMDGDMNEISFDQWELLDISPIETPTYWAEDLEA